MEEDGSHYIEPDYGHIPVLAEEVMAGLHCRPGGMYVDCTVGQGGLVARILDAVGPTGIVIGIDRDEETLRMASERLKPFATQLQLIHGNFRDIRQYLRAADVSCVDGIVFDLGLSSVQLDDTARGFSFMAEGPLDMRMDRSGGATAAQLLGRLSEAELSNVIFQYGEERYARRIARSIIRARERGPMRTTADLVSAIRGAIPASYRHGRIHFATRTFQALRIAVNGELDVLAPAFRDAAGMLTAGGRLCIISFHSLEDRIAKQTIRELSQGPEPLLRRMTKKPVIASEHEVAINPRSRSAKLRIAERLPQRRCA
ncbi:MAG TPA: 16S rRNA (cytosine(1402)-N(4))-methyltransferase RsmH [Nitrospiraceae bacterium]|nr:16S rRNA (cytosine(1402)-N(4))-methyltransferase RsmH [Nitrospiraceae bacterium]